MEISIILPTYNPDLERLRRTVSSLGRQTLDIKRWEILLVDNNSDPKIDISLLSEFTPGNIRIAVEPKPGLSFARLRGFNEAHTPLCVLVDDDNLLAYDYLQTVIRLFAAHPQVGAIGGKSLPEFEVEPPVWAREFFPLLALRDLGDVPCISSGLRPPGATLNRYPVECAPIGAGMAIRREAAMQWVAGSRSNVLPDRSGKELTSSGDNDIILTLLCHGWEVAYFPELRLTHIIPASRMTSGYLARLNHGIQKSWMQVLTKYEANPWPPVARWTIPLRKCKAWFSYQTWAGPTEQIRWQGACGHFEGRAKTHGS